MKKAFSILALLLVAGLPAVAELKPERLRTDGLLEPLAADTPQPTLSWALASSPGARAVVQVAYQVQAATSLNKLTSGTPDLWDSGEVESTEPGHCRYAGSELHSAQRICWRVRLWDEKENPGPWSPPEWFETGLLHEADWKGPWIQVQPQARGQSAGYLRTTISLDRPITSARAYISGLGWSELYVNGQKMGDHALDPAQTDYKKRCFYVASDITDAAQKSGDFHQITIGVILGDGWFNQNRVWGGMSYGEPCLRAQFVFTHSDGTQTTIAASDSSWEGRSGPIINDNVYAGENYDARLELGDWSSPGAPKDGWLPVVASTQAMGNMAPQSLPPVRCAREISAKNFSQIKPGVWIYDFGENVSGWERLKIKAEAGTQIRLRFAERTKPNGTLDTKTGGPEATGCEQIDTYTAKGDPAGEIWHPRFTCHGFRYAELTIPTGKLSAPPAADTLDLMVLHTDFEMTGKFTSSDEQLNHLHDMAVRTMLSNDLGVPSDCPVRERCGWTGDGQCVVKYELDNADAATFFRKFARDIQTGSSAGGMENTAGIEGYSGPAEHVDVPAGLPHMIAPGKRLCDLASPDWGCAVVFIPWQIYSATGDADVLDEFRGSMETWADWQLTRRGDDGILHNGLGDWCSPSFGGNLRDWIGTKEIPITSTAMLIRALSLLAKSEAIAGDSAKSAEYAQASQELTAKWTSLLFRDKDLPSRSETALAFGVQYAPDPAQRARIFAALLDKTDHGHNFDTGIFGTPLLLKALSEGGQSAIARELLTKPEMPSYRALWDLGATTLYEGWPKPNAPWNGSLSHPMQGGFDAWLYEDVAGLAGRASGDAPWQFRWNNDPGLSSAAAEQMSPLGPIRSSWSQANGQVTWKISVPPGSKAEVSFPDLGVDGLAKIRESGTPLSSAPWLLEHHRDAAGLTPREIIGFGSGDYQFSFSVSDK